MRDDRIHWLSKTQPDCHRSDCKGVQLTQQHHPLIPPGTQSTCRKRKRKVSEHSAKRQRVGPSEEDEEDVANGILETPRANSMLRRGQTTLVSADSQSQTSGRSSPSKQMDALELSDFKWNRQLSIDNPEIPDELYEFLTEMSSCSSGIGIISQNLKAEIKERSKTDRSFRTFQDFMFADPNIRDAIGYTPVIDEVEQIVQRGKRMSTILTSRGVVER
ncbi:hypothetical protein V3481_017127 [Fusarium oxysporum f. sp. vasinfectum]